MTALGKGLRIGVVVLGIVAVGCDPESSSTPSAAVPADPGPGGEELSRQLGVKVEMIQGEFRQYLVHARPGQVDFSKAGEVVQDLGYTVGVILPDGMEVGFRFSPPTAKDMSEALGVKVEVIPNEANQYLVQARRKDVDFSKVGTIHLDAGASVGVTLNDGLQVGFRFGPPSAAEFSKALGVEVQAIPNEVNQYLVLARPGKVDFSKVGEIHTDHGSSVGVTLPDGMQVGFRFGPPSAEELSKVLRVEIQALPNEVNQYLILGRPGSVDFSLVGTVHSDSGNSVGVTLPDGMQIGFRFGPPSDKELSKLLGVEVKMIPSEVNQYYVYAKKGTVDFTKVGKVHQDLGSTVGVTLPDGMQIGFRYARPKKASPPATQSTE